MKPGEEAALEIFDKAMETEREGIKVYEEAAAKAQDVKAREIFQMLAKAECRHLSIIELTKEDVRRTYSSHTWKGDFVSEIGKEIEAIGRQYLPKSTDEIVSASALDAINMGMKVEQDSITFYSNAKTKVTDPGVANLFNILLASERVHLLFLELEKNYVTYPRRA
ncbi:ferritin family protein [Chloroflexota bacterium]